MLNASVGFGGSCFRKDIMNHVYISESLNLPEVAAYWESVLWVNEYQKDRFTRRIVRAMHGTLSTKRLAILGFAYKKDTGDTRESPAITIVSNLLAENAEIAIFDPKVRKEQILADLQIVPGSESGKSVEVCSHPYEACQDAHAAIILTEWDIFSNRRAGDSRRTKKQAMLTQPSARAGLEKPDRPAPAFAMKELHAPNPQVENGLVSLSISDSE